MSQFKYKGKEYQFDIADADDAEKYEKAIDQLTEDEKELPKAGHIAEINKLHCNLIKNFFSNCLGECAGDEVCGTKSNVRECYAAYFAFLDVIKSQKDEILEFQNYGSRYTNRSQRRAAQKKPTNSVKK